MFDINHRSIRVCPLYAHEIQSLFVFERTLQSSCYVFLSFSFSSSVFILVFNTLVVLISTSDWPLHSPFTFQSRQIYFVPIVRSLSIFTHSASLASHSFTTASMSLLIGEVDSLSVSPSLLPPLLSLSFTLPLHVSYTWDGYLLLIRFVFCLQGVLYQSRCPVILSILIIFRWYSIVNVGMPYSSSSSYLWLHTQSMREPGIYYYLLYIFVISQFLLPVSLCSIKSTVMHGLALLIGSKSSGRGQSIREGCIHASKRRITKDTYIYWCQITSSEISFPPSTYSQHYHNIFWCTKLIDASNEVSVTLLFSVYLVELWLMSWYFCFYNFLF